MRGVLAIAVFLGAVPAALGQTSAGRITGSVLDSSGAMVPNAKIVARNSDTGVEYPSASNGEGSYMLYPLPPGIYTVTVEASGFRTDRIEGVQVEVGSILRRDVRLEVAATRQEAVVVSEASAPLVTESPAVASGVEREQIENLPLNSRDFNQLVLLAPGAAESGDGSGNPAINGNRSYGNDYTIDGASNSDPFLSGSAASVSVDLIREFKVTSGVAAAEYGQGGAQVRLVTRSGSNRFHGSAFEYLRNTTLQASNPFNPAAAQPFSRHQLGGSLGGPIARNRTFFFFNYEGNRQDQSRTLVATMPQDAFWSGDFSSLLARRITVRDPLASGTPAFPGNIIPASRLDATALKLHPYFGSPNRSGVASNYVRNSSLANSADQGTARVDQALPHNQNLSLRYTETQSSGFTPSQDGNSTGIRNGSRAINASLGWTAVFRASTVNELLLGYNARHNHPTYDSGGLPTTDSVGMLGFGPLNASAQPMPRISFSGNDAFTQLNYGPAGWGGAANNESNKISTVAESVTHTRGTHTFKAGAEIRRQVLPTLLQTGAGGLLSFSGGTAAASSTYSFADFLLGLPNTSQLVPLMASMTLRQTDFAWYGQDDWRASRKLTLSLGLRYELTRNPTEGKNRLSMFDPKTGAMVVASDDGKLPINEFSPIIVARLTDGKGNWTFPLLSDKQAGFPLRTLLDTQYYHFGPRVGFAYHLSGNRDFILRGGYGIFYNRYPIRNLEQVTSINPPFAATFNFSQAITNGRPAIRLQDPFAATGTSSIAPDGLERNWISPSSQQWNMTLERGIGWRTIMSIAYIGNKGTHLFRAQNVNATYLDPVTGAQVRAYQSGFGGSAISLRTTDGDSTYHSMQTIVRRRFSKGMMFDFSWTWAKSLDDMGESLQVSSLDIENRGRDRADSDYVRRHTFRLNWIWDLPVGHGKALLGGAPRWLDAVAGGWRLSGIWTDYSGRRFTPAINNTGLANTRPQYVWGVAANLPSSERSIKRWFNPAAFTTPPAVCGPTGKGACFGNAGRNILVGPGTNVVDASLAKTFAVFGEGRRLTFRVELFNAFNHPNYRLPDANISNVNTVATITDLAKDQRQAQFAFRFDF